MVKPKKQTLSRFYDEHRIIIIILGILLGLLLLWFLVSSASFYKEKNCDLTFETEKFPQDGDSCYTNCIAKCVGEGIPFKGEVDYSERTEGYGLNKKIICVCECGGCKE